MMKMAKLATTNIATATSQSDLCTDVLSTMDERLSVGPGPNIPLETELRFTRAAEDEAPGRR
jgi:hypothetical protein